MISDRLRYTIFYINTNNQFENDFKETLFQKSNYYSVPQQNKSHFVHLEIN